MVRFGVYLALALLGCLVAAGPVAAKTVCRVVSGMSPQEIQVEEVKLRVAHARFGEPTLSGRSLMTVSAEGGEYAEVIQRRSQGMAPPVTFEIRKTGSDTYLCAMAG